MAKIIKDSKHFVITNCHLDNCEHDIAKRLAGIRTCRARLQDKSNGRILWLTMERPLHSKSATSLFIHNPNEHNTTDPTYNSKKAIIAMLKKAKITPNEASLKAKERNLNSETLNHLNLKYHDVNTSGKNLAHTIVKHKRETQQMCAAFIKNGLKNIR